MTDEELEHEEPKASSAPTRHAKIMRGIVTPVFGLIAVACIVLGVLNATIWSPSTEIVAQTEVSGSRYIVTDPGVLGLVDDHVSMTVEGSDAESSVCIATGAAKDVSGWLSGESYVRITGLSDWSILSTADAQAQGESLAGDDDVSFADSDMWTSVECGDGSVTLGVDDEDSSQIALVDLGEDQTQASVTMDWVRREAPDFAMPFYFVGGLCIVLAILCATVFAMPASKRRKRVVQSNAEQMDDVSTDVPSTRTSDVTAKSGDTTNGNEVSTPAAGEQTNTEAVSIPPRSKRRRRHARHGGDSANTGTIPTPPAPSPEQEQPSGPIVVDPGTRNMVADQLSNANAASTGNAAGRSATASAENHDEAAETSVISQDELAAYFARLAQESQEDYSNQSDQSSTDASTITWGRGIDTDDTGSNERRQ